MEKKLNSHYFSTTPKNSWELFKWIFTEPIKLKKFSDGLQKKETLIWLFKTYFWIVVLSIVLFLVVNVLIVFFDIPTHYPTYFKGTIVESWVNLNSFDIKVLFLIKINLYKFAVGLTIILGIGFVLGIVDSLTVSLVVGFIVGLAVGLTGGLQDVFTVVLTVGITISFVSGFKFALRFGGLMGALTMTLIIGLAFSLLSSFAFSSSGLLVGLMYDFVLFGCHSYLYHFLYSFFTPITLEKNPYLKDSYIFFPIYHLEKKIANDGFNRPILAHDFIKFLFEFRPYQRKMAFYLSNVFNASKLYHHKLSHDVINIPEDYEKNQPKEDFTKTLLELKHELGNYQTENNIQSKMNILQKVIKILKNLEKQMIIEQRGWSEYYLRAIRANLDEADAKLKNLEIEAKNREPITANIYRIGDPLSPNHENKLFKGRKDLVEKLSQIVYTAQQMPLLLIQGQRRVGKTSLINYLEQLLGSGFKIVKLDMQSATNKCFNSLVNNINQTLNKMLGINETIETSEDICESWIAFENYLTKNTKVLNYKIIIAFDEYESFHTHIVKKHGENILGYMRSFTQSQNQVIFLFAGMLSLSDLTSPNWDEYFPQAQTLKVDYLSKKESLELITHPVEDFNLIYDDAIADEVYNLTMGHPQLLQTICSLIVDIANRENQKEVIKAFVEEAKEKIFNVNDKPMSIFWRGFCNNSEREVIEQILENREIEDKTIEQKRAVARLIEYGFITKEKKIRVPLFEKWLLERRVLIEI